MVTFFSLSASLRVDAHILSLRARLGRVMNEMKMILFDGVNRLSMRLNV